MCKIELLVTQLKDHYKDSIFNLNKTSIVELMSRTGNGEIAFYYCDNSTYLLDWSPSTICAYMTIMVAKFNGLLLTSL